MIFLVRPSAALNVLFLIELILYDIVLKRRVQKTRRASQPARVMGKVGKSKKYFYPTTNFPPATTPASYTYTSPYTGQLPGSSRDAPNW
jgi:hypothetical protein